MEKIQIVDGKIVSQEEQELTVFSPEPDPLLEELEHFSMDLTPFTRASQKNRPPKTSKPLTIGDFRCINGILIPKDTPYLPAEYDSKSLKRREGICPYLLKNDVQDYAMFMDFLKNSGKQERTCYDYTVSLRKWKKELEQWGGELRVSHLNHILKQLSAARACNMLIALRAYANYRNLRGDNVLLILLSSSRKLYHPVKKKADPDSGTLSAEEAEQYWALARTLCKEEKKAGIWIGLSLLGVTPGNLAAVEFPDKSHVRFKYRRQEKRARLEKWLYDACQRIEGWRLGRRGIHHGVSQYETNPHALNRLARRRK